MGSQGGRNKIGYVIFFTQKRGAGVIKVLTGSDWGGCEGLVGAARWGHVEETMVNYRRTAGALEGAAPGKDSEIRIAGNPNRNEALQNGNPTRGQRQMTSPPSEGGNTRMIPKEAVWGNFTTAKSPPPPPPVEERRIETQDRTEGIATDQSNPQETTAPAYVNKGGCKDGKRDQKGKGKAN